MKRNLGKIVLCLLVLSVVLIVPQTVNAKSNKGISIKENFGNYKYALRKKERDKNQDGYLSKAEIKEIKSLDLREDTSINVKGISKLKYLEKLTLDTMKNVRNLKEVEKLRRLKYLKIGMETKKKRTLDLRKNKKIETLYIYCLENKLNVKIRKKNIIKNLYLEGAKNSMEIANKCKKVQTIEIEKHGNQEKLNLVNRKKLKKVYLCTDVKEIKIQNCAKLEKVKFNECKSTSCTIENNPKLQFIKMYQTKAPNLTIQNLKGLKWINIDGKRILKLSLNGLDNLRKIKLYNAKGLTDLTISDFPKLWKIDICRVSDLQSFTVENLKNLKQMNCMVGKVTELNIVGDHKLKKVRVCDNKLKTFAYDNLKNVRYLDISNNQIEGRFDFTLYPNIYELDCSNNRISEIYGGPLNREIGYINCSNNNMKLLHFTELDKYAGFIFYVNCKKNPDIEVHAWMEDYDSDPTANIPYH